MPDKILKFPTRYSPMLVAVCFPQRMKSPCSEVAENDQIATKLSKNDDFVVNHDVFIPVQNHYRWEDRNGRKCRGRIPVLNKIFQKTKGLAISIFLVRPEQILRHLIGM